MCQYFRVIKSARRRGPVLYKISLNSTEQPNKNYTEISLFDFVFACFDDTLHGRFTQYACASLTRNSCRNIRHSVATRLWGACVDVSYVNTWIQRFLLLVSSVRLQLIIMHSIHRRAGSAANRSSVQFFKYFSSDRRCQEKNSLPQLFYYIYYTKKRRSASYLNS